MNIVIIIGLVIAVLHLLALGHQFGKNGPDVMHRDQVLLGLPSACKWSWPISYTCTSLAGVYG